MSSGSPRDTAAPPTTPNGIGKGVFISSIILFVLSLVAVLLTGSGYFTLFGQKMDKIARKIPLKAVNPNYQSLQDAQDTIAALQSTPAVQALYQAEAAKEAAAAAQTAKQAKQAAQAAEWTARAQARAELGPAPSYYDRFQRWRGAGDYA